MGIVKPKNPKRKWVIWTVLTAVGIVATLMLLYLYSIPFEMFFPVWSPRHIKNFDDHEQEFLRIIEEVDQFMEKTPDFFETFTGDCFVVEDGLVFFKPGTQPLEIERVLHPVTTEDWSWVRNYSKAFPPEYNYGNIYLHKAYPDYVFFCSDERTARFLVYTRGDGRPRELIDDYRERYENVYVKRVAKDWYDIYPRGDKRYLNE